eukprot:TRINITY_DN9848_c2_g1_i2.p1 TRINITY_DN9848_c2_g1~~TRINITY_DN9848_c2_g1_i2.p1  ORF type:complete len:206 (-),score=54.24 TRINITY_DN9848_c2_g1_i2:36-653(-)
MPLFIILSPTDYYNALEGYYIRDTRQVDYYLEINTNEILLTTKQASYDSREKNKVETRRAPWGIQRKVVDPSRQYIELITPLDVSCFPEGFFGFDRYKAVRRHQIYSKSDFKKHLKKHKVVRRGRICGAEVVTPGSPCCHEAISDIAREVLKGIPREHEDYRDLLLEMSVIVENLAQECMVHAMTDAQIHHKIIHHITLSFPQFS